MLHSTCDPKHEEGYEGCFRQCYVYDVCMMWSEETRPYGAACEEVRRRGKLAWKKKSSLLELGGAPDVGWDPADLRSLDHDEVEADSLVVPGAVDPLRASDILEWFYGPSPQNIDDLLFGDLLIRAR